jgi:hypothetical protein
MHIMSCTQIMVCHATDDFEHSWLGHKGVSEDDWTQQYIVALYFVTTTLSTCGFGDISAT